MSLYQYILKNEIERLNNAIIRNNNNIKELRRELLTGYNLYSFNAHYNEIVSLTIINHQLKLRLKQTLRLVH